MKTLPSIKGNGSTFHCVDRVLSQMLPNFAKVMTNWKMRHATVLRTTNFTTAAADETAAAAVVVVATFR